MDGIGYVDGIVTTLVEARVPLSDRGYLLGDGVFETIRVSNGVPFRLDPHRQRMARGLGVLGMDEALVAEFDVAFDALVAAAPESFGNDLYVRINITGGPMMDIGGENRGISVTGICKKFQPYPMKHYADGIRLVVAPQRKDASDAMSTIKHLSFLPYVQARRYAFSKLAHDAIMLNYDGRVAEASTANVFALVGDTMHAPGAEEGALPGVTRQAILELVEDIGLQIEPTLTLEQLQSATEVFLSNTAGGIVPVTKFNEQPVGDGAKGELTSKLAASLEAMVRGAL